MFKLRDQLPKDKKALHAHITALRQMTDVKEHEKLFDHLYGCLSILDAKSTSLLAFNSIIIAVFAIFLSGELRRVEWFAVNIGMASILVSCLLLLSVVWVHWSTTDNLVDLEKHALILLDVRRSRTIKYRLSWYFSVAALCGLIAFLLIRFFQSHSRLVHLILRPLLVPEGVGGRNLANKRKAPDAMRQAGLSSYCVFAGSTFLSDRLARRPFR